MVSPQTLGSDIEYPLRSNALSAKSVLGGRVALTLGDFPWRNSQGLFMQFLVAYKI